MAIQTLYLTNSQSAQLSTANIKSLSLTYGTTNNTSTSINAAANQTSQYLPAVANSNNVKTITTVPSSQGWLFDKQYPGRFWPGSWTIQTAITTSGLIVSGETGNMEAKLFIVTPSNTTTVTEVNSQVSGLFSSTAQTLANSTVNFSASLTINNFFYLYPNQFLYVEIYWVVAGRITTLTSAINVDSSNTFIKTSFFEEIDNFTNKAYAIMQPLGI